MSRTPWQEPFTRFGALYEEAKQRVLKDPNAMSLATVDDHGQPTVRVVLMKDFDARGFVFFTNFDSAKGHALQRHPRAGLNFHWPVLEQQVRIEGTASAVSAEEADAYFATRPRVSQLGAWASEQSRPLSDRETLERRLTELTQRYEGKPVPRPPYWSGFRVSPHRIEFWRAHEFRLHWREEYAKDGDGWVRRWLNP